MTTPEAAARYEADHVARHSGMSNAIFNPEGKMPNELPTIFGFNNGGNPGWYTAQLISQDGIPLGNHICSSEAYMPSDLGILEGTAKDRHKHFQAYYPKGYKMEFVSHAAIAGHEELQKAIEMNNHVKVWKVDLFFKSADPENPEAEHKQTGVYADTRQLAETILLRMLELQFEDMECEHYDINEVDVDAQGNVKTDQDANVEVAYSDGSKSQLA